VQNVADNMELQLIFVKLYIIELNRRAPCCCNRNL